MAPAALNPLNFPPLISRRLPEICKRAYRPFSSCRSLRADGEAKGSRSSSDRLVRDLNAKYRGIRERQPQRQETVAQRDQQQSVSPALQRLMGQAQAGQRSKADLDSGIEDPHHLHVYSHRHNTHVTLTRPNRSPMLSISAGNIGFKHAQRGSYDAAFQLASYAMSKMLEKGMVQQIKSLELVMRGFGAGREAFQKALLSNEGRILKGLVTKVTDATRLKFGGTRSRNVRRL